MINQAIKALVGYGLDTGLITRADEIYARNQLLEVLGLDEYEEPEEPGGYEGLEGILKELLDYGAETGVVKDRKSVV